MAYEKLTKFNNYLVENCINSDLKLTSEIWTEKAIVFIEQLTNSCESFHFKFNSQFYSPHPNIFNFLNILFSIYNNYYKKF